MGRCMSQYSLWSQVAVTLKPENQGYQTLGLLVKPQISPVLKIIVPLEFPRFYMYKKFIFWKDRPDKIRMTCSDFPYNSISSKIVNECAYFHFILDYESDFVDLSLYLEIREHSFTCKYFRNTTRVPNSYIECFQQTCLAQTHFVF